MAKKNNTKPVKQATGGATKEEAAKKKLKASDIYLIVFGAVALVAILVGVIVGCIRLSSKNIDYMKANLSKYVKVSESIYKGYGVTVNVPPVTDRDVEYKLLEILCENKLDLSEEEENAPAVPNVTISAGDIANIYYRGYTLGENNVKDYFDGGCNFDGSISSLEIGSGSFIPGFEYNLIGKNQKDYATMTKVNDGFTKAGDIIMLTYSAYYADGRAKVAQSAMIDLSDPNLDEVWGEGFADYFNLNLKGFEIGKQFAHEKNDQLTVTSPSAGDSDAEKDVYFDMTVTSAYRISEGEKLVVEAYFPADYHAEDLQGKTAYFEVYIKSVKDHSVPELNDAFITETLKLSADQLASYEGETLVDKYKSYVKAGLVEEYNEKIESAVETAFWKQAIEKAQFKKLPESEVKKYYNSYVSEIETAYASGYSNYYNSVDAFALAYLNLESGSDWKAALKDNAEYAVKQKLVFYKIIRQADYIPEGDEYDRYYDEVFNDHLESYLEYYKINEDSENYATKLEEAKTTVRNQYDDEYWNENVIYAYALDKIIDSAVITNEAN